MTKQEMDDLVADPSNRGLTAREVIERLGPLIAGCESTVRRTRRRAALDSRGYPLHSSHHFVEMDAPVPESDADGDHDKAVRRVMMSSPATGLPSPFRYAKRRRPQTRARTRKWPTGEHVYFMRAGTDGPIKIGCTQDLDHRYAELSNGSPVPITVIGFIRGYRAVEQRLHALFDKDRLHGEWFRPSERLLAVASGDIYLTPSGTLKSRDNR